MRKHISVGLLVFAVLVLAVLTTPSAGQAQEPGLKIVKISVPELDLFADDKSTTRVAVLETSRLKLPLDVMTKAPNGRLKIELPDKRQVWIEGMYVTFQPSTSVAPCDPGRAGIVAGATRGSGARCK